MPSGAVAVLFWFLLTYFLVLLSAEQSGTSCYVWNGRSRSNHQSQLSGRLAKEWNSHWLTSRHLVMLRSSHLSHHFNVILTTILNISIWCVLPWWALRIFVLIWHFALLYKPQSSAVGVKSSVACISENTIILFWTRTVRRANITDNMAAWLFAHTLNCGGMLKVDSITQT